MDSRQDSVLIESSNFVLSTNSTVDYGCRRLLSSILPKKLGRLLVSGDLGWAGPKWTVGGRRLSNFRLESYIWGS